MTQPFRPQRSADLKARFSRALEEVVVMVGEETNFDPGTRPEVHIFDFEDGLRLLVSQDDYGDEHPGHCVHFSVSVTEGTPIEQRFSQMAEYHGTDRTQAMELAGIATGKMIQEGVKRFRVLSGYEGNVHVATISDAGVPHVYVTAEDWKGAGLCLGV